MGFSSCFYVVVVGFWLVSGMLPAMANSDRLDASLKAALQATMIRFIDNASDDEGGFRYIERQSGALITAYPGVIHPKIIPVGDDYFLCIDMLAANGTRRLVDFLVREGREGWMVVDVIVDRRDLVKKALASME
ncbi:hypothetical protein N9I56_04075 [Alphaproteobacteria bacterium]|nr:hypothetical protein [Alphaproteobacteria bacterium]